MKTSRREFLVNSAAAVAGSLLMADAVPAKAIPEDPVWASHMTTKYAYDVDDVTRQTGRHWTGTQLLAGDGKEPEQVQRNILIDLQHMQTYGPFFRFADVNVDCVINGKALHWWFLCVDTASMSWFARNEAMRSAIELQLKGWVAPCVSVHFGGSSGWNWTSYKTWKTLPVHSGTIDGDRFWEDVQTPHSRGYVRRQHLLGGKPLVI